MARDALIVRDYDDGQAILFVQLLQHSQHFLGRARVEIAGWLVSEQQLRAIDERAGDIARSYDEIIGRRAGAETGELANDVLARSWRIGEKNDEPAIAPVPRQCIKGFSEACDAVMDDSPDVAEPDRIALGEILHQAAVRRMASDNAARRTT